jgi:cytochrome c556
MKLKLIAVMLVLAVMAPGAVYEGAAPAQQGKATAAIMQKKLKNAQKLFEGIALADFSRIGTNAEELLQLSKAEEWMVYKTPKYEMYNNEFQRALTALITKAKAKNIDGVTLSFVDMTMSCVRCHSYVREIRDARLAPKDDRVAALRP